MTVRTRFAPSPTGYLHVGGARTALFCYLFAKKNKGTFILRIEDTDLERSTPEAVQAILDGMAWLGLNPDEGPYYQTKRFDRYKEVIQQWLIEGKAYRCYCSKERLEQLRERQMASKEKPRYDGQCRHANHPHRDEPYVVRFKNPESGQVVVHDQVHGDVIFDNKELDDLIIARSDGTPTYNFTVVVDDADMNITHVIRGDDHLNNTPRQINMLEAMGAPIPQYAHLPMILGDDGKKLSKRHGAVSVMQYHDDGFVAHALLNYLVRLGWSHGDQEIFTMEEMIDFFSLDHLSKSAAAFNTEKLLWLNQHYLKTLAPQALVPALRWQLAMLNIDAEQGPPLTDLITAQCERCKTLKEMAEKSITFYTDDMDSSIVSQALSNIDPTAKAALQDLYQVLLTADEWQHNPLHQIFEASLQKHSLKLGKVGPALRNILTAGTSPLPITTIMVLLGKKRCLERLKVVV